MEKKKKRKKEKRKKERKKKINVAKDKTSSILNGLFLDSLFRL
jgi:hypothetical protein